MNLLARVLSEFSRDIQTKIDPNSKLFCLVELSKIYCVQRLYDDAENYRNVRVIVPLNKSLCGYDEAISGTELAGHFQLTNGLIVPPEIAATAQLSFSKYDPFDVMFFSHRNPADSKEF